MRPAWVGTYACEVPAELVPPQAARTSIDPRASRYSCGDRLMRFLLPELRTHLHGGGPPPWTGYTMMQTSWQEEEEKMAGDAEQPVGPLTRPAAGKRRRRRWQGMPSSQSGR